MYKIKIMKKILLFLILIIPFPIFAQIYDFRKANWGMTKDEVKANEQSELIHETTNFLCYESSILELDCWVYYIFAQSKLVRTKYAIIERYSNYNDYISDYESLKNNLIKKYGLPQKDQIIWKDKLFKDEPQSYGLAISIGHLVYFSYWETEKTIIRLGLYGNNYEIKLAVEYESKELGYLEDEEKEKEALDKL